jgi:NADH-quinone oxidoreductase subunit A
MILQLIKFWPFLIYTAAVLLVAAIMIGLSHVLGERHREKTTGEPFESGIPATGNARLRFSSHFYLIAIFFVVFDIDAVFIMVWAISFRETGITGYIGILIFIAILIAVLAYEIGIKALNFGPRGKLIIKNETKTS